MSTQVDNNETPPYLRTSWCPYRTLFPTGGESKKA